MVGGDEIQSTSRPPLRPPAEGARHGGGARRGAGGLGPHALPGRGGADGGRSAGVDRAGSTRWNPPSRGLAYAPGRTDRRRGERPLPVRGSAGGGGPRAGHGGRECQGQGGRHPAHGAARPGRTDPGALPARRPQLVRTARATRRPTGRRRGRLGGPPARAPLRRSGHPPSRGPARARPQIRDLVPGRPAPPGHQDLPDQSDPPGRGQSRDVPPPGAVRPRRLVGRVLGGFRQVPAHLLLPRAPLARRTKAPAPPGAS